MSTCSWVSVLVCDSLSRYVEGKMLKGTGTRASKSRLTTFAGARESSHTTFRSKHERKTRRIPWLLFVTTKVEEEEKGEKGEERGASCFQVFFLRVERLRMFLVIMVGERDGEMRTGRQQKSGGLLSPETRQFRQPASHYVDMRCPAGSVHWEPISVYSDIFLFTLRPNEA